MTRSEPAPRLRLGIAGAGFMGALHATLAVLDSRVAIVAVADLDRDAAEALGRRLGAAVFDDVEALLTDCPVDLLVVATTPSTHADLAVAALARGVDVLVEKPLCLSRDDLRRVARAAEVGRGRVFYAENLLFAPRWQAAYHAARSLGHVNEVRAVFATSGPHALWLHAPREGNVLFDLGSHAVATCLHALPGRHIESVCATGSHLAYADERVLAEAVLTLRFDGGETARCEVSWRGTQAETCALEIIAPEGSVACDMDGSDAEFDWIGEGGYGVQMRAAIDAALGLAPYPVTFSLAEDVVTILEEAMRSIEASAAVAPAAAS